MSEEKKEKKLNIYFPYEDPDERPLLIKIIDRLIDGLKGKDETNPKGQCPLKEEQQNNSVPGEVSASPAKPQVSGLADGTDVALEEISPGDTDSNCE